MENRMFEEMLKAAKIRLKDRKAEDISKYTKLDYDAEKSYFLVSSMGKMFEISYPDFVVNPRIDAWHLLTILHYMDMADGFPLNENLTSFGSLKDGLIRGGRFDQTVERELEKLLKNVSEKKCIEALEALGGVRRISKADLCMEIPILPMYPLIVNIWFADDEYPASGKLLLDESADHYLTIEDAVTVGNVFLRKFSEALKN